jgi:uncharacterized RmlC-like cupin family protein
MSGDIRLVRPDTREGFTPRGSEGIAVEHTHVTENAWAGIVRFEPRGNIGWHHHGEHDTYVYVLSGGLHVEFGPGGRKAVEAAADDFVVIPKRTIHRETNPTEGPSTLAFVRVGKGRVTFDAEGPDPA